VQPDTHFVVDHDTVLAAADAGGASVAQEDVRRRRARARLDPVSEAFELHE
jgi:hypothetical protein